MAKLIKEAHLKKSEVHENSLARRIVGRKLEIAELTIELKGN